MFRVRCKPTPGALEVAMNNPRYTKGMCKFTNMSSASNETAREKRLAVVSRLVDDAFGDLGRNDEVGGLHRRKRPLPVSSSDL